MDRKILVVYRTGMSAVQAEMAFDKIMTRAGRISTSPRISGLAPTTRTYVESYRDSFKDTAQGAQQ